MALEPTIEPTIRITGSRTRAATDALAQLVACLTPAQEWTLMPAQHSFITAIRTGDHRPSHAGVPAAETVPRP